MTVPMALLAVFAVLLVAGLFGRGAGRRALLPVAVINILIAASQVAMPQNPRLGWSLMAAALAAIGMAIARMERVARGAAFRTMRAPMLMASGAVVCIFAAELLPDNSRLMVPTLELVVLLTAGFISISTHSLVAAVMAARARQRVSS